MIKEFIIMQNLDHQQLVYLILLDLRDLKNLLILTKLVLGNTTMFKCQKMENILLIHTTHHYVEHLLEKKEKLFLLTNQLLGLVIIGYLLNLDIMRVLNKQKLSHLNE